MMSSFKALSSLGKYEVLAAVIIGLGTGTYTYYDCMQNCFYISLNDFAVTMWYICIYNVVLKPTLDDAIERGKIAASQPPIIQVDRTIKQETKDTFKYVSLFYLKHI